MDHGCTIRRAESSEDGAKLRELFSEVFHPQQVGILAETIFRHLPGMERKYWFIAEDKNASEIASAFALIPWTWEMEGIRLKVAEMGIVGTREKYRKKGLMRILNREFDDTLEAENFDLAVIQGIPGFYHNFGFRYSVPLENHVNLPPHLIPDREKETYAFRLATSEDIPFLMEEDETYRKSFSLSVFRSEAKWRYLLNESLNTEYGSEYWIAEHVQGQEKCYCRIPQEGFGKGLIVSEVSVGVSHDALMAFFFFWKQKAAERGKPYVRLNLHNDSVAAGTAIRMGAERGMPYAWQIKLPDKAGLLRKIGPILEKRMANSCFGNFSETIRLNFFSESLDLTWNRGRLESVESGDEKECPNTFCVNSDLFPVLCLGHRSWQELQHTRPDIFPMSQYVRPDAAASDKSGLLADTLFPPRKSWIYEQY